MEYSVVYFPSSAVSAWFPPTAVAAAAMASSPLELRRHFSQCFAIMVLNADHTKFAKCNVFRKLFLQSATLGFIGLQSTAGCGHAIPHFRRVMLHK